MSVKISLDFCAAGRLCNPRIQQLLFLFNSGDNLMNFTMHGPLFSQVQYKLDTNSRCKPPTYNSVLSHSFFSSPTLHVHSTIVKSTYLTDWLTDCLPTCLSVCLPTYLSVCLPICLPICYLPIYLSTYLSVMSVCQSFYLSVWTLYNPSTTLYDSSTLYYNSSTTLWLVNNPLWLVNPLL